ncbi:3-oxoacyl-ACP reductase FabG [bacterium]|nr:3-oxoacyl-ACP reductase FabG [bacterium]
MEPTKIAPHHSDRPAEVTFNLTGKCAVVTGSSQGIGRAIAFGLARAGAAVVVNYPTDSAAADEVVSQITAEGARAIAVRADVGDLAQHRQLIDAASSHFGRLDILVNNAAVTQRETFLEATPDAWDRTMDVNLKGIYFLSQAAARLMVAQGSGKIVNISSVHDTRPMAANSVYNITKAAVVMLTKSLALELAGSGIQVNCVSPGAILTSETRERLEDPVFRAKILEKIPARQIGEPDDVVAAVLLLASAASGYINGATLTVDGGMLLQ